MLTKAEEISLSYYLLIAGGRIIGFIPFPRVLVLGASGGVMVSKIGLQTYMSEFESHWVPLSYGLVPHLSKKLSKFPRVLVLCEMQSVSSRI